MKSTLALTAAADDAIPPMHLVQKMEMESPQTPLFTRQFGLLLAAHFLQALGFSSMLLLPLYLDFLGASRAELGLLMALPSVSGLLVRPVVAWALDVVGRRPTLMVGTLVLSTSVGLLFVVRDMGWPIYFLRILFGVGVGALFSSYFTLAADVVPASRRTEGLAIFGASGLFPLLVNPLYDQLRLEPVELRWFLPMIGVFIVLSLIPLSAMKEERRQPNASFGWRPALRSLTGSNLWPVWWATVVFATLVGAFMTFATVAAERRGMPQPSSLWLSYAGGAVFVRLFGGKLPDRIGNHNLVVPALSCYTAASLLLAAADTQTLFLVVGLLAGIGHGYCFPVLTAQVVSRVDDGYRGTALTMFTALWALAELVASPLLGMLADSRGDGAMFTLLGVVSTVALALWVGAEHRWGTGRLLNVHGRQNP